MSSEGTPMEKALAAVQWEVLPPQEDDGSGLPYATHSGVLQIGAQQLRVYRLNTGQAIINAEDFEAFFELLAP